MDINAIKELQECFNRLGEFIVVNGCYDSITDRATQRWQQQHGYGVTGRVTDEEFVLVRQQAAIAKPVAAPEIKPKTLADIEAEQKSLAGLGFDYGPLLSQLFKELGPNPCVVELGTFVGCAAVYMATHLQRPFRLHTVDKFDAYGQAHHFVNLALRNFKASGVQDDVNVIVGCTWEASALFNKGEVDLLWVDAGHDFASVNRDLFMWYHRLKPGAILAGHDYSEVGVRRAVDAFAEAMNLHVNVYQPGGWESWCIKLP